MSDIDEFKRINTRSCSVLTLGGFRPTRHPLATHFGLPPAAAPGEAWPEIDGRPLFFVCQLNLTEAPFVPPHARRTGPDHRLPRPGGEGLRPRERGGLAAEGLRPTRWPRPLADPGRVQLPARVRGAVARGGGPPGVRRPRPRRTRRSEPHRRAPGQRRSDQARRVCQQHPVRTMVGTL